MDEVFPNVDARHLILYTRARCSLCDEARAVLHYLSRDVSFLLEEVDVDGDPELRARYTDVVPVGVVEGEEVFRLQVDVEAVKRALGAAGA